ncbi:hypothetical protein BS50DRAFT_100215 [Corynespora cassiicola Philippines]|uniref:Ankyrin n=1 Tax=Corynespora cassiicola Philippines TaxID=1448308 RepID=A0A2T2N0M9_CORCC|nr:hypothetical protein BS50DRAFT_100215 [Corynespora cassiicola Philippines]
MNLHFVIRSMDLRGWVRTNVTLRGRHALATCSDEKTVDVLPEEGFDLEGHKCRGDIPLAQACNGSIKARELLLVHGAGIRTINGRGKTLLNSAAHNACPGLVAFLINRNLKEWSKCSKESGFSISLIEKYHLYLGGLPEQFAQIFFLPKTPEKLPKTMRHL